MAGLGVFFLAATMGLVVMNISSEVTELGLVRELVATDPARVQGERRRRRKRCERLDLAHLRDLLVDIHHQQQIVLISSQVRRRLP
jgi:hypothetical protein